MTDALAHRPVMVREVLAALNPRAGALYIDATFGGGGYSSALLAAADCRVFGIDRDPRAAARAEALARRHQGRLTFVLGRFGDMLDLLRQRGVTRADGVAFDLGVSSPQIDDPARGFSFRADGPLDMRMGDEGPSAAEIVNTLPEATLADILYRLGEERRSRAVARAIVAARAAKPITRTLELAEIVRRAVGPAPKGIDAATRSFQAIRIYTNDELGELDRGLSAAEILLNPGGRLAVVAFHSLEDRAVKSFLRSRSGAEPRASRHMPIA
ncbi:MAG: 16S rRNA (cytosine(1402)-N(4))-methyltransferase RsmH, partial [Alphaproteobacteria bacterium]|nr:16S rRNA (cytosine(1402)-N(4))-methyltransferase RsmH [Alphaproteobacteria bacterium]